MGKTHYNTWTRITAVLTSPSLYELASRIDHPSPVGRPRANPAYVVLAYGVMARIARSGIRVELDLADRHTWNAARELMARTIAQHGLDLPPPGPRPPKWDHWRWMRNMSLATDEGLADLARHFPPVATAAARRAGQLPLTGGAGSFTHPDPTRCVYGDGTLVRPLYRPPEAVILDTEDGTRLTAYPDPRTGLLLEEPPRRYDPDLLPHHGKAGPVLTHGYVCWHTRGPKPYGRIDLAAAHIPEPGAEANTAVQLLRDVHRAAGPGIQVVIYDGAMRGVHIDHIMRTFGYLVLAKQHTDSSTTKPTPGSENTPSGASAAASDPAESAGETPAWAAADDSAALSLVQTPEGKRARSLSLGPAVHQLPTGPCVHQLAAAGGHVVEIDLDERGDPVVIHRLTRGAVKRARRSGGQYHFNVGYQLACPSEPFTVWLSPHPGRTGDTRRPEQLRIIPTNDPDYQRLYGLRSDAESFHSNYKRTLIVDRAMSLGWRRGLVDLYCFVLYNNALTEYRVAQQHRDADRERRNRRTTPRRTTTAYPSEAFPGTAATRPTAQ